MGKDIMVLDDTADIAELMGTILTLHDFQPRVFSKPFAALEALKNGDLPDLLILDMRMPEMSGIDFCEELRKDARFDNLKIAFFTASSDLDHELLKKYRVLGFIFKPFNVNELIKQINNYLLKEVEVQESIKKPA
jgi:DNA-binding response OmpR family regulator